MTNHCMTSDSSNEHPGKYRCPINGKEYHQISARTIEQHIKEPWKWEHKQQGYYFCDDPDCDVVYFGEDHTVIEKRALRTVVGVKRNSADSTVCYCYGVDRQSANDELKKWVMGKTRDKSCACEIRNPSGRCCLKDFP